MDTLEQDVQKFMEVVNEEFEINGYRPGDPVFNFEKYDCSNIFIQKLGFSIEYLHKLIKICEGEGYIESTEIGDGYSGVTITPLGKQHASFSNNQRRNDSINIKQITIYGQTQIGNDNTQNFYGYSPKNEEQD